MNSSIVTLPPAQPLPTSPPRTTPPESPGRFVVLDGLRGAGAFAVIHDHVPQQFVNGFLPGRALSVDFFFVLSGLVLAHAYDTRLRTSLTPMQFMRVRLIRLYPLFLLGMLIALPIAMNEANRGARTWLNVIGAMVLGLVFLPKPPLSGSGDSQLYPLNGPAWSLMFELFANFIYAFLVRLCTVRNLLAVLPVFAAVLALTIYRHDDVIGPGWLWGHVDSGIARVLYGFFTGVLISKVRTTHGGLSIPPWAAFAAFFAVIGIPAATAWRPAFDSFASIVVIPAIVFLASNAVVHGPMARLCGMLGQLSYGTYMLHVPLLGILVAIVNRTGWQPSPVLFIAVLIAASAGGAALADRWYDGPVRRLLLERFARRRTA